MFKRILAAILVVSLCLTTFCVLAEETASAKDENAVALLNWLGVAYEKNEEQYSSEITRADFAVYTARALGIDDTVDPGETRYYIDMAMYDYASYSVNCLVEKGVLSVAEDKMFRPGEPITYYEAVKMVVCALGYKPVAETRGGYPNGYSFVAKRLNILGGASATQKFTLGDAVSILYEAMRAPLYIADTIKVEEDGTMTGYRISEDNTLLYENFGYKYISDILTGFDGMNISFDVTASTGLAAIGGKTYKVADDVDLEPFIGRNTCVLIDKDDFIVYGYCEPKKEEATVIDARDFISYDGDEITYNYNDKTNRTIDVSNATVLYNGAIPSSGIRELVCNIESGSITVIDSDGDGTNDAMIVNDYKAYALKSADTTRNIIYSKISGQNPIELNSYRTVEITDKAGVALSLEELEKGDMLNVLAAADKSRIRIIVTDDVVTGMVEQVWDGDVFSFKAGGGVYNVNKAHTAIKSDIKPGQTSSFLLNMFGEVVIITEDIKDNYQVGYLIGARVDGVFSTKIQLRMYTKNGGIKVFDTAEKLRVDGERKTDGVAVCNAIPNAICDSSGVVAFKSQMILYKTNADGLITDIDTYNTTAAEDPELTLARVTDGETALSKIDGRVSRTLPVNGDTDFYCVPQEDELTTDTENYKVVKQGSFNRTVNFKFECYKTKGKNEFVDVVLYRMNPADTKENAYLNSNMFLVGEKAYLADKEGNRYVTISGLMQAGSHSIDVYESRLLDSSAAVADIDEGDLIRYRKNETGSIIDIQMLYDYDAEGDKKVNWTGVTDTETLFAPGYTANFQLTSGFVSKKGEKTVSWGYKSATDVDEVMDLSAVKCMFYDGSLREGSRLYTGSMDSIADCETAGADNCDIIIVQLLQSMTRSVVVYKR